MHKDVTNIFILYNPGYAGNLILRLIALSKEVMPTMKKQTLLDWSSSAVRPCADSELHNLYTYDTAVNDHKNWLAFHDAWAGIYEHTLYDSLIDLGESYNNIAYQIHPYEFLKFEDVIEPAPKTIVYVDLDLSVYSKWIEQASNSIGLTNNRGGIGGNEVANSEIIRKKYPHITVSLTNILDSTISFNKEYLRLCTMLNITPRIADAETLYLNWRKHRVDNVNL